MLVVQNAVTPAAIRNAIADLLHINVQRIRIASAYTTMDGSRIVYEELSKALGANIDAIPKELITSFDYGLTDPAALNFWNGLPNAAVKVAGAAKLAAGSLRPSIAFHPKVFAFDNDDGTSSLFIGSANMTGRGLSINTEAGWAQLAVAEPDVDAAFAIIRNATVDLTPQLVLDYAALRAANPPPPLLRSAIAPVPTPTPVAPATLPIFKDELDAGNLNPAAFNQMWVQTLTMSGGSGNQVELPRGGHRFFGFIFNNYAYPDKITIGQPTLVAGNQTWQDRMLSWHGNNMMERINMPTQAQGGVPYAHSALLFRRLPNGHFEIVVAGWNSNLAKSWRQASALTGRLYRAGHGPRLVGMI